MARTRKLACDGTIIRNNATSGGKLEMHIFPGIVLAAGLVLASASFAQQADCANSGCASTSTTIFTIPLDGPGVASAIADGAAQGAQWLGDRWGNTYPAGADPLNGPAPSPVSNAPVAPSVPSDAGDGNSTTTVIPLDVVGVVTYGSRAVGTWAGTPSEPPQLGPGPDRPATASCSGCP